MRNTFSRNDPFDYIWTHDCRSKGTHAAPRWRPKTPTFASSTNYNIQAVRPVEAEGGTESSLKQSTNKSGQMIRLHPFGAAIVAHPQRGRSQMIRLITFGTATVAQDRRAAEKMIRLCPSGPAPIARTCCEVWKVIRLAPSAPAPVDQTKCRQIRLTI